MKYVQSDIKVVNIGDNVFDKDINVPSKNGQQDVNETDGYISKIRVNGKTYKLRCEIVEVYDMTCQKCGAQLQLHYGSGRCEYCGTYYSTQLKIME